MLYIEQSLAPGEKVVMVGRFHWVYMAGAFCWLVAGIVAALCLIAGSMATDIGMDVRRLYHGLPVAMLWQAGTQVMAEQGGLLPLFMAVPPVVRWLSLGLVLCGVFVFVQKLIVRATTEVAVTTSRLVLKEGVVARAVDEMNIDRIESVHVYQSILGRMFGYGTVMVRGMGIGEIVLPTLADPVGVRRAIEKAKQINETMKP